MIDFFPHLLRHTIIPMWALCERSPHLRIAARLERERTMGFEERRDRQLRRLRWMVEHAWRNVPFYRERFEACGFRPSDLRRIEDLSALPVLTKHEVREHGAHMISAVHAPEELMVKRTSGSTGMPLRVFIDAHALHFRRAVGLQRDQWTGWRMGERRALLWGPPPPMRTFRDRMRNALVVRASYLDTLRTREEDMRQFASRIRCEHPTQLFGHAHSLHLFARFWESRGLPAYRFRAVQSTAMLLLRHERDTIERVFGTRVFDRYGCEELGLVATECEAHEGLHVNMDALIVEIVPDGTGAAGGRVVVTDLRNSGMPFIRYELGDRAVPAAGACACGRSYPLLHRVTGRVADYLYTPSGALVSGISLTEAFASHLPDIEQVQIVQDRIDHLLVRLVPGPSFGPAARETIARLLLDLFGPGVQHSLHPVERIPPEPSGKYRFTICALPERAASPASARGPDVAPGRPLP